jgi:hypothetical protein
MSNFQLEELLKIIKKSICKIVLAIPKDIQSQVAHY